MGNDTDAGTQAHEHTGTQAHEHTHTLAREMKKKDPTSHRIIEKRRRDRMNNCLADLSKLIPAHYMKKGRGRVEKTEIIEMAIKHLKDLIEMTNAHQHQHLNQANLAKTVSSTNANSSAVVVVETDPGPHVTIMTTNQDLQTNFSSHCETSSYLNHHNRHLNVNKPSHSHHRSSPASSVNGSDSSSSSSSSSGSSVSSSSSVSSIGSSASSGIISSNGCCDCGASIPNGGSAASLNASHANFRHNNTQSTNGWYKKTWLVRSFSRSPQR